MNRHTALNDCFCQRLRLCLLVGLVLGAARAEFIENPDENTRWREDGREVGGWRDGLTVTAIEDGFRLSPGTGHSSGRYVPLSPEHPWLTWRVREVVPATSGYRGWTGPYLIKVGHCRLGQVSELQEGIFAVNVAENSTEWPRSSDFLRLDLHGATLTFEFIQMVRTPANYLEVIVPEAVRERGFVQPGDELTFRVVLAKPAEDVSLRFYNSYTMPQMLLNGRQALQLRMADDTKCVWQAAVVLQSFSGGRVTEGGFKPGSILVKAVILGGGPGTPVWGTPAWPIATTKKGE